MELIIKLQDESKLDALLNALRRLTASEGVGVVLESPERGVLLDSPQKDVDWSKWDELMSRDKLRPGQPPMTEEEEIEFINQAIKETRAKMRAEQP
ncbi:MAG: hypothetical protein ABI977_35575 [Acidobacteriota bacterium]